MGVEAFLVGLVVAPLVQTSAFVATADVARSAFTPGAAAHLRPATATAMVSSVPWVCMSVADEMTTQEQNQVQESCSPSLSQPRSSSRGQFVGRVVTSAGLAAVAAAAGGGGGWTDPVWADSTGKYSSKATAKKRYLPRIVTLVKAFQLLKKDIASGSASPKSEFFGDLLADSVSAMDLYGSSMKKSELPDSKSRALQQLARDFGSTCTSIGKSLGKKGGEVEASKNYDKAAEILAQYLKGVELDPLGSEAYN